ncbi:quercetin dioxygenase-like cupin family protein [Marmoricola bigeumensis]|uniref:Quercetin dioxygenase-like cupin family protein n=2 Tax=Nocardioides marmoribigeumensis TaxID=433649 RepID=A0ABU2BY27_9ACTN|nr:quercetin dioxygenase-like cupin family protein [Nocardioides marmoribigeumensis]
MAGSPYPARPARAGDRLLVSGDRTQGRLAVLVRELAAGAEVPPRRHTDDDVVYVVLEGEVAVAGADGEQVVGASAVLHVPPGTSHRYRALTDSVVLVLVAPAGAEHLLLHEDRLAAEDPGLLLALAQEHRVALLPGLLP